MKINLNYISIYHEIEVGRRIDNFLFSYMKNIPKSLIYSLLRKGKIRINDKMVEAKYKLKNNDKLCIPSSLKIKKDKKFINYDLNKLKILNNAIIYEDSYLIVLNKPYGIAVHGGSNVFFNIIDGLKLLRPQSNYLKLVHRLDQDTSGVLLIAKNNTCLKFLHDQMRLKKIKKEYLAIINGRLLFDTKIISTFLSKKILTNGECITEVSDSGKYSKTKFENQELFSNATLVKITPITGRTHQIRVHSKYIGHPIIFDKKYGNNIFDKHFKSYGLNRMFLHAYAIYFIHPNKNSKICIKAPLDNKLEKFLFNLRITK